MFRRLVALSLLSPGCCARAVRRSPRPSRSGSKARRRPSSARRQPTRRRRPTRSRPSTSPASPASSTTTARDVASARTSTRSASTPPTSRPAGCSRSTASRRRSAPTRPCSRTATSSSGTRPTFGATGGPPTLELKRLAARNCYVVQSHNDTGNATPAAGAMLRADGAASRRRTGARPASASTGLVRATLAGRRSLERAEVIRRALGALAAPRPPRRLRRRRGGEQGTAKLWVTRDRGADRARRRAGRRPGRRCMRALASEADVDDALRRPLRPVDRRPRRPPRGSAGLVLVRQRLRGRPERAVLSAARRRRRLVRLSGWQRRARRASSSALSRSRSCTATTGRRVRRPCATTARRSARRSSAAQVGADSIEPLGTPAPAGANVLELRDGPDGATARAARPERRRPGPARPQRRP